MRINAIKVLVSVHKVGANAERNCVMRPILSTDVDAGRGKLGVIDT